MSAFTKDEIDAGAHDKITLKHDRAYPSLLLAIDIVRDFIRSRGCILYGGIAIDYALRLRGDKIYEDDAFPDFDFLSPNHVETVRELLTILNAKITGERVYSFNAMYPRTIRISVGNGNWIADVSYAAKEIYDKIPTLTYDGMRVVHPHHQFTDLHSSMTFPYDGPPREVVLARWAKDVKRYNKLYALYPLPDAPAAPGAPMQELAPLARDILSRAALTGFAAYSVYYDWFAKHHPDILKGELAWIPRAAAPARVSGGIAFDVPCGFLEYFSHNEHVLAGDLHGAEMRTFSAFLDMFEAAKLAPNGDVVFAATRRLIGHHSAECAGEKIRVVSVHALLKHFIAYYVRLRYFEREIYGTDTKPTLRQLTPAVFVRYYKACLAMMAAGTRRGMPEKTVEMFSPHITPFGSANVGASDLLSMYRNLRQVLGITESETDFVAPPTKVNADDDDAAQFPYDKCPFYRMSGAEIL